MSEPTYRQTLSHAWQLVWHHKILWIFGLLSVLLGQFGLDNFIGQLALLGSGQSLFMPSVGTGFPVAGLFKGTGALWSVWLLVVVLGVLILSILMTVAAQGALIAAAGSWFKIKRSPNLTKAWHTGVAHFWWLLLLNVVKKILFLGLLWCVYSAVVSLTPFETVSYQIGLILIFSVGLFCALIISATTIYAAGYIVMERKDFLSSISNGWGLFLRHFLASLELSIIFLLMDVALVALITMGAVWFFVPSFIFTMIAGLTGLTSLVSVGLGVSMALLLIFVALLGSFYNAFITSAWTYAFMKMHREGVASRLVQWVEALFRL